MSDITDILDILNQHERKFDCTFSLVPSENHLSDLARIPYSSDCYSRYFFDENKVFGRWSFEGGSIVGRIQTEILEPALRRIGGAEHVNLHAVSGLTAMTLVLAAFGGPPGSTVLSIPTRFGGHPDTAYVGDKLGYKVGEIPFADWDEPDFAALSDVARRAKPSCVYVDHATHLFPIDHVRLVEAVRAGHPTAHIHADTSHVNGLIWGGALPNPLAAGLDSYGGSTHKTFPGPHKALVFTNDQRVAHEVTMAAVNMVSHHHTASVVSLALAVAEFEECDGASYARRVVQNANSLAAALHGHGFSVSQRGGEFTRNHQVWMAPPDPLGAHACASMLFEAGLVVNPFDPIPSLGRAGIRMGVAEPTRLGLAAPDMAKLAELISDVLIWRQAPSEVARRTARLRRQFTSAYCVAEDFAARARGRAFDRRRPVEAGSMGEAMLGGA